jgi:hypothetical protein
VSNLEPLPPEDDKSIREGMKLAGLGEYLTATIRLGEYQSLSKHRCIIATLTLETIQTLEAQVDDVFSSIDRLKYLGNHIGQAMQYEMVKQLPCIAFGDKIIMSRQDYEKLRKGVVEKFNI